MLAQCASRFGVAKSGGNCLMGNHVHLIAVPHSAESLARCFGLAHQRYAAATNARSGWTGNLWANRFYSSALDEDHMWTAVRYVERNPVRAKMVNEATDWIWSSARCHAALCADDLLAPPRPFPGMETDWPAFLARGLTTAEVERIRVNTATGRPTGSEAFVKKLEQTTGRLLRPLKRGVKPGGSTHSEAPVDDLFS